MGRCSAFGCKNEGSHLFPKNFKLKKQWENALKLKNFRATKHSRLCSEHFKSEDFKTECYYTGCPLQKKMLKKGVVPSIFSWKKCLESSTSEARKMRAAAREIRKNIITTKNLEQETVSCLDDVSHEIEIFSEEDKIDLQQHSCVDNITTYRSIGTQKNYTSCSIALSFRDNNKDIQFYTGLESYEKFMFLLNTLLPEAHFIQYRWKQVLNLSVEDQFLLTLIKLKRNKEDYELAKFFDIHRYSVSNIFVTWVNFMHQMWEMLDIWPSRTLIDFYMPHGFAKLYPSTRAIVDCTEVPIQRPSNPAAQKVTWSSYKNRSTVKFEIGASPSGLLSHCSEAYAGSASDRQIIERSSLLDKFEKGDSIMVDRGLNVQDLFAAKGVAVNIPTFLRGKSQLTGIKVLQDRKLSSKRVHIERVIGLTKTYRILQSPVHHQYVPLMSKLYFVCHMLCNFRDCIVSDGA